MGDAIDMQRLADRAAAVRGRITLSSVIGADVKLRRAGAEQTGICPFHSDRRDGAFMVNDTKQIYKCFACGASGDVIGYVMARKGKTFMQALKDLESDAGIDFRDARQKAEFDRAAEKRKREAKADAARRRHNAKNFWLTSAPGADTPAQRYFEGRGIDFAQLGRFPGAIRFRPDAFNTELGKKIPAIVTAIVRGPNIIAVHRTFLEFRQGGWQKARVDKPKMVLGDFYGGSIALWKGAHDRSLMNVVDGTPIVMGEGIEDGLSAAMGDPSMHVRAAISLDNIGNVELPPQAGDLILLGQRDKEARERAAMLARARGAIDEANHHERCAHDIESALERAIGKQQTRGREDGSNRRVCCAWPGEGFKDFNDELRGIRMEGAA